MMLGPYAWLAKWVAVALVIIGLAAAVKVQTARLDAAKADFSAYRAKVEALGREAEKAAQAQILADKQRKERADAENAKTKRDLAGLYAAYTSLRDQPRGSLLPASAPGSGDSDRACFSRAALDRGMADADAILQAGARKILFRGDSAIADLNTAKQWANP